MSYGKLFPILKKKTIKEWKLYTNHEFLKQLSSNNLKEKSFLNYLVQDYLFLIQFSKAWSLALVKADNLREMKLCSNIVNGLINFEMDLHIKLCNAYGISKSNLETAKEENANIAYTRYVLERGYTGDFLDIITVLLPCVLGYAEIGKKLQKFKPANKMYRKWIGTYSGTEYQRISKEVGKFFDESVYFRLGNKFTKTYKWKKIEKNFRTATLLEIDFWQMALK